MQLDLICIPFSVESFDIQKGTRLWETLNPKLRGGLRALKVEDLEMRIYSFGFGDCLGFKGSFLLKTCSCLSSVYLPSSMQEQEATFTCKYVGAQH